MDSSQLGRPRLRAAFYGEDAVRDFPFCLRLLVAGHLAEGVLHGAIERAIPKKGPDRSGLQVCGHRIAHIEQFAMTGR